MQISENQGKKILALYRVALINNINESPVNLSSLRPIRNLYYQLQKEQKLQGEELMLQLESVSKLPDNEQKLILFRLITNLPLKDKVKTIDIHENEILTLMTNEQYSFEYMTVINDLLMSTYLLIRHNQELYGATISRIVFLYGRMMQISNTKQYTRNLFEVIRTITHRLNQFEDDQLLNKLAFILQQKTQDFLNRILACEARTRIRLLLGFCRLLTRTKVITLEFITKLEDSIVDVVSKVSECECLVDGIGCIYTLLWHIPHPAYVYNRLLKVGCQSLVHASFRKQYLGVIVEVLTLSSAVNHRLKYQTNLRYIQISRQFQSQYTRLVLMKLCLKNLLQISKHKNGLIEAVLRSLFHQKWFVTALKEQNALFREEFLISLITEYFEEGSNQVKDIMDICHRMLDWNCNMKVESNVQTIRFTFDLYLLFLGDAYKRMGVQINPYLDEIVSRINSQNINFLFKMKILTLLARILTYQQLTEQLKTDFIEGELKPFMMPRQPKSIFTASYASTSEGVIQSAKEVEYIRNILNLLTILPNYYHEVAGRIDDLIAQYHDYLTVLQVTEQSNKQLISTLLELSDEPSITQTARNILLSIYQKVPELPMSGYPNQFLYPLTNSSETSLLPVHSPVELIIEPHSFLSNKLIFSLRTVQKMAINATIRISSGQQVIQTEFESNVHEIQIAPTGVIDFEVVSEAGSILGLGKYSVRVDWGWKRVDWFVITQPIRLKAAWKGKGFTATFLSVYWGQPLCISFQENSTELCLCVCSRDIIQVLIQDLQNVLDFLTNGKLVLMR